MGRPDTSKKHRSMEMTSAKMPALSATAWPINMFFIICPLMAGLRLMPSEALPAA